MIKRGFRYLSSSILALVLVLLVILFSLAGAVLPQEGRVDPNDLTAWFNNHPGLTAALKPLGLFGVFHSWPFLVIIFLLLINTLTCTVSSFFKDGGFSVFKGQAAIEKTGFYLLHISLVLLFTGGFFSTAAKLDGFIVLTEGQSFTENHNGYLRLVEGPLRPERHKEFVVILTNVKTKYEKNQYLIDTASSLTFLSEKKKATERIIKVNKPFTYKGLSFTLHETGFSPRLMITEKKSGKRLVDSFVALKTFQKETGRQYRDFLPLPFLGHRIIVTLYPCYFQENGEIIKAGEEPDNPILIVEVEDESGKIIDKKYLSQTETVSLDKYSLAFTDLRRWAAFKVIQDPGYPIIYFSLILGIITLILRYIPDLLEWFKTEKYAEL